MGDSPSINLVPSPQEAATSSSMPNGSKRKDIDRDGSTGESLSMKVGRTGAVCTPTTLVLDYRVTVTDRDMIVVSVTDYENLKEFLSDRMKAYVGLALVDAIKGPPFQYKGTFQMQCGTIVGQNWIFDQLKQWRDATHKVWVGQPKHNCEFFVQWGPTPAPPPKLSDLFSNLNKQNPGLVERDTPFESALVKRLPYDSRSGGYTYHIWVEDDFFEHLRPIFPGVHNIQLSLWNQLQFGAGGRLRAIRRD